MATWGLARSGYYAALHRRRNPRSDKKRGPERLSDEELVQQIRELIAEAVFHGEGYRKIWARLRHKGIQVWKERVLRLMREHQLLVFEFCLGRGREGPRKFLGNWAGILQTDGYQAYEGVGGPGMTHVACWAHARRKFVDAVKVNPQDAEAAKMVIRMDALFLVDRNARKQGLDASERQSKRQEHARPWLDEIRQECLRIVREALPQSATCRAAAYTLKLWDRLARCLKNEDVELSNNLAENSMRGVALGRKNWLHVGSPNAGPKVAAILSVTESCRRLGVSVRDYLADVLPDLDRRSIRELAQLTPSRWAAAQA